MVALSALWLPILLSAVLLFITSSILHQVLPWHTNDYGEMAGEDGVLESMRAGNVAPGQYFFPFVKRADFAKPESKALWEKGPVGFLLVRPSGMPAMGSTLAIWFGYLLAVSACVGYLAGIVLGPGTDYMRVFRVVSTAAFLAYSGSVPALAIWMGHSWKSTFKHIADGLLYALLTAGLFGWLWP